LRYYVKCLAHPLTPTTNCWQWAIGSSDSTVALGVHRVVAVSIVAALIERK